MTTAWQTMFWTSILLALVSAIAYAFGGAGWLPPLGAAFLACVGLTFLLAALANATTVREAWLIGQGRVTPESHPWAYWFMLSIPGSARRRPDRRRRLGLVPARRGVVLM
jgi:hypothetical protein